MEECPHCRRTFTVEELRAELSKPTDQHWTCPHCAGLWYRTTPSQGNFSNWLARKGRDV